MVLPIKMRIEDDSHFHVRRDYDEPHADFRHDAELPDGPVRELSLQLLGAQQRCGAHAAHQVGPLPGLTSSQP
jgi:hypothetical protein